MAFPRLAMAVVAATLAAATVPAHAKALKATAGKRLCATLAAAVDAVPGSGPAFVQSYKPAPGEAELPGPLRNAAFVYDNAVLAIALVGCGRASQARRIADAMVAAETHDRAYTDGRIRNAYKAGAIDKLPVALPGYWNFKQKKWLEDGYQAGTAVGNVAWAALALLHVDEATGDSRYLDTAKRMMGWVDSHTLDKNPPAGFTGGFSGFEPHPARLPWKSTEHNIDVMAVSHWLAARTGNPRWQKMERTARSFVDAMFHKGQGFEIGTTPDNKPAGYGNVVLDVQLWPSLALAEPPPVWRTALETARSKLAVDGGFDFNSDRDGVWTEGTAQAALAFAKAGKREAAEHYLGTALAAADPKSGWLFATREGKVTTGLTTGPGNIPFYYFHRPHIGATAWATLAALDFDPFLPENAQ